MALFDTDIEACLQVLHDGGIILYPTDTIWGIGCDATNNAAVERIITLKQRPSAKSFVVLVASERDILQYVAAPDLAVFDYLETTSKPTSVIYDHALGLADAVISEDGSVAIRICRDEFCKHLVKRFRKPVVSTSANISGTPSPGNFEAVDKAIIKGVDYTVGYRQAEKTIAQASAIIRWQDGKVVVIRE